ncbi:MAG: hypothetical protein IPO93_08505 [Actinobacteria bacterium]|nr:hypothetical protein [Actinomycetota bacterium]
MSKRIAALGAAGLTLLLLCPTALVAGPATADPVGATAASAPAKKPVPVMTKKTALGTILVSPKGRTVYVFMADSPGTSNCTGSCLTYWPPVAAPAKLPASVPGVTGSLGTLVRDDGTRQLTINGWPLYTYAGDTTAGATSGQGSSGSGAKWWAVSPAGKKITTIP